MQSIEQPWEAQEEEAHPNSGQFNLVSVLNLRGGEGDLFLWALF